MESLVQPDRLRTRILLWAEEEVRLGTLPSKAGDPLEAVLYRGALRRGEAVGVLGLTPRHARRMSPPSLNAAFWPQKDRVIVIRCFPAAFAARWSLACPRSKRENCGPK